MSTHLSRMPSGSRRVPWPEVFSTAIEQAGDNPTLRLAVCEAFIGILENEINKEGRTACQT